MLTIIINNKENSMKLSTRGRYGTRVLLDLALCEGKEPVPLRDIAQREQISLSYLEHLITPLIAAGMIRSMRGARGGIRLAKTPEEIKLSDVIGLLEGSITPVDCLDDPKTCTRSDFCVTRDVWGEMKEAMNGVLESTTIQDLVERHKSKERPVEIMYQI